MRVLHVCQTSIVGEAWQRRQELPVHGWIYGLQDGRLRDLNICITGSHELMPAYEPAIADLPSADWRTARPEEKGLGLSFLTCVWLE